MKTLNTFFLLLAFAFSNAQSPNIVLNDASVSYGLNTGVYMGASSDSPGKFTYSIANDSIGTISQEGLVTILRGGTTSVTVSQEASGSYAAGSKTATLKVNKAYVYSVQMTSPNALNAEDSLLLTASSGYSTTKFKYSIQNETGTNATIKGSKLYAGSTAGTLNIVAEIVADDNFEASTSSSTMGYQAITVFSNSGTPNLTMADMYKTYGDAFFRINTKSNSKGAITFSKLDGNGATIASDGLVTITGAGIVTIQATQEADGLFTEATTTATLSISKANATVNYTGVSFIEKNDSTLLTATTNPPGATIAWTLKSQPGTNASIKNNKLYAGSTNGSLNIAAEIVADDNFNASTSSSTNSAIQFYVNVTSASNPNLVFDDYTYNYSNEYEYLYASSNSYGTKTYSLVSGTAATVEPSGRLTKLGLGTIVVKVEQAATSQHKAATKTATITIVKTKVNLGFYGGNLSYYNDTTQMGIANDSISFTTFVYPGNPTLEFSIKNQDGTNAVLKGTKLYTGATSGTLTLMIKAIGSDYYYEAVKTQTIKIVGPQQPEINFKDSTVVYGQEPFWLQATSNNSNSPLQYSIISGNAATIYAYGQVTINGAGSVTVKATQTAYPPFAAATKTAILTVLKASPTITITSRNDVRIKDSLELSAISSPIGASFKWAIVSQTGTNASIVGNKLYAGTQRGSLKIKAIAEAQANFNPANSEEMEITVDSTILPTMLVSNLTNSYGNGPFNISVNSNSQGALSFSSISDSVASVSESGFVTIKKAGKMQVTITQAESAGFKAITRTELLTITKALVYGVMIKSEKTTKINDSLNLTAATYPAGATVKWRIGSQSGTNATIKGAKLYGGTQVGTLDIVAEVVPDDNFAWASASPTSGIQTITINSDSGTPTLIFNDVRGHYTFNSQYYASKMLATSNSTGAISYSIVDEPSATISSDGVITFRNLDSLASLKPMYYGDFVNLTVLAFQAASPPYEAVSKTAKFTLGYILLGTNETSFVSAKPIAYPNPAKDLLQIRSGKGAGCNASLQLYNMNGELQNTTFVENGIDFQINISELTSGVYSLKMTFCDEVFTQKVVKQ